MERQEIIINGEKYIKLTGKICKKNNGAIFSEVVVKEEKEHDFEEANDEEDTKYTYIEKLI